VAPFAILGAFQSETRTIPIVVWSGDLAVFVFISSLARPGGNITGVGTDPGPEFAGKRLRLFAEAVGNLSNVRALMTPANWPFAENLGEAAGR
jgi:putative ABC transport system substrate-binding protein